MKQNRNIYTFTVCAAAMTLLILDAKTALSGAEEGVLLCIRTVIPSLFPFLLISVWMTSAGLGMQIPGLRHLGVLCRIPAGTESLLLIGLLGGYPVGARCITQTYNSGTMTKNDAKRMLGFCSNAGPAFIFGMTIHLFSSAKVPFVLWGIQILSALITGCLLPGKAVSSGKVPCIVPLSMQQALENATKTMAQICGWVVIFRIFTAILDRWFLWILPAELHILFTGLMELSNGCISLTAIASETVRFVLCSMMLSFGGICVIMQTISVTAGLGMGWYFPGKLLQCCISFLLALLTQYFIFTERIGSAYFGAGAVVAAVSIGMICFWLRKNEKSSRNSAFVGV